MNDQKQSAFDKIRVLLIDDMPAGLPQHLKWPHRRNGPPQMDVDYEEWFEFRWVATPQEACEFRDLSWLLSERDARLLEREGWVPEVMPIDYALTQDSRTVSIRVKGDPQWLALLSPLPSLRACARRVLETPPSTQISVQPRAGNEYWGCFVGGLLMTTFADHPCVPVTITKYDQNTLRERSPDAKFFEELMHVQTSGLLRATGTESSPSWQDIIPIGMKHLRHRLEVLAKASIVTLSFADLIALSGDPTHKILTVDSRFGQRKLPVEGLFIDQPAESPQDWATRLLAEATGNVPGVSEGDFATTLRDWRAAEQLCNSIWTAYCNEHLVSSRWQLSKTLDASSDASSPTAEGLLKAFDCYQNVQTRTTKKGPNTTKTWKIGKSATQCMDIRHGNYSDLQRRWAALMIIIRLLHHHWVARNAWNEFAADDVLWADFASELLSSIDTDDVYLALHPVASEKGILPWHSGDTLTSTFYTVARLSSPQHKEARKEKAKNKKKARSSSQTKTGVEGEDGSLWGDLGLCIDDVLAGLHWTDDPIEPTGERYHGMRSGEQLIMSWYANTMFGSAQAWRYGDGNGQLRKMLGAVT